MGLNFAGFTHGEENVAGGHIHYRLAGNGDTVVLLHDWPQHSLQRHSVAPRLTEPYRVLVPDIPGCRGSSIPRAGYDKKTIAAAIAELVDRLDLGRVKIVGYDHGAGVAYNYACAKSENVTHLAIVEYVLPGCGYEKAMMPSPTWHTGSNWQLALFTVPDLAEFAFRGPGARTSDPGSSGTDPVIQRPSLKRTSTNTSIRYPSRAHYERALNTTLPSGRILRSTRKICNGSCQRQSSASEDGTTRAKWSERS